MKNIEPYILDISKNYYKYLLSLPNVHTVGLGYKRINNINIFEPCIHVLVNEKINEKYLSKNNIIPKTYMGIKTDVIKVKQFKKLSNLAIPQKLRPLEGGSVISTANYNAGTLGCIVFLVLGDSKYYCILTNAHVLCEKSRTPIGAPVFQPIKDENPNISEKEKSKSIIAHLTDFVRIEYMVGSDWKKNKMDVAIAEIQDDIKFSNIIHGIGKIKGVATPYLEQKVQKVGCASGHTTGKVLTIGASEVIDFGRAPAFFENQISLELESKDGDSGSVVLNEENEVIGLLFAGRDDNSTMTDINYVIKRFNIEIFTD